MPAAGASTAAVLETRIDASPMNRSWLPWPAIKTRTMPPAGGQAGFRQEKPSTHEMSWRATDELLLGSRLPTRRTGQPLRRPEPLRDRGALRKQVRVHGVSKTVRA